MPQKFNLPGATYAYAAPVPCQPFPRPEEPTPIVALYMVTTPDQPFPGRTWVTPSITFTPTPESLELQEIRALRRDFDAMKKMVDRFLGKGKGKAKK